MKTLILALTLALTACATTAKFEAKLNSWVGHSESELVSAWGVPSKTYVVSDSEKLLSYAQYNGSATNYYSSLNMAVTNHYACETTFTIRSGLVHSWRWSGNACKSQ